MSTRAKPLQDLGNLRETRKRRLTVTRALFGADPDRTLLLPELLDVLRLVRGDRAGIVWMDSLGMDEEVCPYAVLDLGHDRPDLSFPREHLTDAAGLGVPGLVDIGGKGLVGRRSRPLLVVSMGADRTRSWFLVVDGGTPRPWLSRADRERVQYIAGRTSAIAVHLDLGMGTGIRGMSRPSEPEARFAGAALLKDLRDERHSERMKDLAAARFLVARLVARVMELDGAFPSHLAARIPHVRRELADRTDMGSEEPAWRAVLRALEAEDHSALAEATLALARHADSAGHDWSFAQLSSWAYDLAVVSRSLAAALSAADAMATACAKVSDSDAAAHWTRVRRSLELVQKEASAAEPPFR